MIKFFNGFRKKLLAEGKLGKYFQYALGEILLVMIGILLALQVNNWNEERKVRAEEQILLRQLQTEFEANLEQLDEKIKIRQEMMNSVRQLMSYIDEPESRQKDSVNRHIALSVGYTTFDPVRSDIANSGGLMLIRDQKLKQLLSYWTSEFIQVTESEQTWYKYRNEVYVPFLIKHYQLRTSRDDLIKTDYLKKFQSDKQVNSYLFKTGGIGKTKHKEDFNFLLDQPDFEDHLTRSIVTQNICDVQSQILKAYIKEILQQIRNQIDD